MSSCMVLAPSFSAKAGFKKEVPVEGFPVRGTGKREWGNLPGSCREVQIALPVPGFTCVDAHLASNAEGNYER